MATLWPMTKVGSSSPLYAADGDFIGVEASPTGATDHRGFNEAAAWTVRAYDTLVVEHYDTGVHSTLRVPRAIIVGDYDGALWETTFACYCQSTSGTWTEGTTAATLAAGAGAGQVQVTLAHAMPSNSYRIKDLTLGIETGWNAVTRVHVYLESITSTTVFNIRRWAGTNFNNLTSTDGLFAIAVYDG